MAKYRVRIKKSAEKELVSLPLKSINAIKKQVLELGNSPFPPGYKKLKNFKGMYRIRVGDYRIIYTIYQDILIIEVLKIAHRKDIYD